MSGPTTPVPTTPTTPVPTTPRNKGGRPRDEVRRQRRGERLARELENCGLEVAAEALGILRDKKAAPGIRIQAAQLITAFQDRGGVPPAPTDAAAPPPASPETVTSVLRSLAERIPFADLVTIADAAAGNYAVSDPVVAAAHLARARAAALEVEVTRLIEVRDKADEILRRLGLVERFATFIEHEGVELRELPRTVDLRSKVEGAASSGVVGGLLTRPDPNAGYKTMRELAAERRDLEAEMDVSPRGRHPLDRKY